MLDKERIARIKNIKDCVVANFDAGDWELLATYLGSNGTEISNHPRLLRSLHFGDEDYSACVADVLGQLANREPETLDLVESMLKEKNLASKQNLQAIDAKGFLIDEVQSGVDTSIATTMMPFTPAFVDVRKAMRSACSTVGLELKAADDIWEDTVLIKDIFHLISKACIVIVDFTGKNPNVMYETGIAHALKKEVIPIVQSLNDVPFDLRHHRILLYDNNDEGRLKLQHSLEGRMRTIIEKHGWLSLPF